VVAVRLGRSGSVITVSRFLTEMVDLASSWIVCLMMVAGWKSRSAVVSLETPLRRLVGVIKDCATSLRVVYTTSCYNCALIRSGNS